MSRRVPLLVRPSVPPVLWLALGVWAGALFAEGLSWRAYAGAPGPTVLAAALPVAAFAAVASAVRPLRAAALFALAGVLAGLASGGAYWGWWRGSVEEHARAGARTWRAVLVEEPEERRGSLRLRVHLEDGATASVACSLPPPLPRVGRAVVFRGVFSRPDPASEWGRVTARRGEVGEVRAWRAAAGGWRPGAGGIVARARVPVCDALGRIRGPGGDLLAAVLTGDRRRIAGSETEQDFRIAGASHLLVASALYVGVVSLGAGWLTRKLGVGRPWQVFAAIACGALFASVAGMRASMLRALVALAVTGAASLVGRRRDPLSALGVAVLAIVLSGPQAACDLGLALGASVVAGLGLFGALARRWVSVALPGRAPRIAASVSTVLVAQCCTLPIAAGAFGLVSLVAPVTAVAVTPLATAGLALGLAGAVSLPLSSAWGIAELRCAAVAFGIVARIVGALAALPGAALALGPATPAAVAVLVMLALALWAFWPVPRKRRRVRLGAVTACLGLLLWTGWTPGGRAEVVVMDVGQGDAILVRDGGEAMLVDAGPSAAVLRAAVARQRVRRLDTVVLTHDHADHTGGVAGLAGVTSVGRVAAPAIAAQEAFTDARRRSARLTSEWRAVRAGDRWRVGSMNVTVLWPRGPDPSLKTNDTSVVLLVTKGATSVLLTGDAEEGAQARIASEVLRSRVSVLKVAHHGSVNGVQASALDAWGPRAALVSVGEGNDFGHPSQKTLAALGQVGARLYRTDCGGDIAVTLSDTGFAVTTARGEDRLGCATIRYGPRDAAVAHADLRPLMETHGRRRPLRPQTGLPHLRGRGPAAGARGPPVA